MYLYLRAQHCALRTHPYVLTARRCCGSAATFHNVSVVNISVPVKGCAESACLRPSASRLALTATRHACPALKKHRWVQTTFRSHFMAAVHDIQTNVMRYKATVSNLSLLVTGTSSA
jgi:hypothetical protein